MDEHYSDQPQPARWVPVTPDLGFRFVADQQKQMAAATVKVFAHVQPLAPLFSLLAKQLEQTAERVTAAFAPRPLLPMPDSALLARHTAAALMDWQRLGDAARAAYGPSVAAGAQRAAALASVTVPALAGWQQVAQAKDAYGPAVAVGAQRAAVLSSPTVPALAGWQRAADAFTPTLDAAARVLSLAGLAQAHSPAVTLPLFQSVAFSPAFTSLLTTMLAKTAVQTPGFAGYFTPAWRQAATVPPLSMLIPTQTQSVPITAPVSEPEYADVPEPDGHITAAQKTALAHGASLILLALTEYFVLRYPQQMALIVTLALYLNYLAAMRKLLGPP